MKKIISEIQKKISNSKLIVDELSFRAIEKNLHTSQIFFNTKPTKYKIIFKALILVLVSYKNFLLQTTNTKPKNHLHIIVQGECRERHGRYMKTIFEKYIILQFTSSSIVVQVKMILNSISKFINTLSNHLIIKSPNQPITNSLK